MEAKEIVAQEVARQKEFGYEPSWEDFVIAGKLVGIKEVVDWITTNGYEYINRTGRDTWYIDSDEWNKRIDEWQAQLKEWGL